MLLMNDIHISKDNVNEFRINWNEALSICQERKISIIVIGGDLFQSRSSQTLNVLLAVYDALQDAKTLGIHIILANGNHDKVDQEAVRGYCHIYGEHGNVTVVDEYMKLDNKEWGFAMHVIPYFPENGSFVNKLDIINNSNSGKRLKYLYIHQGINGAIQNASDNELPASIFKEYDKVFAGHYHNRCLIKGTSVEYIGSSRQHNFGEDEAKGYTLIYTDGSAEFVKNQANIRYKVLEVDVQKINVHLIDKIEELKITGKYRIKVKVISSEAQSTSIDQTKLIEAGASKIEIVIENTGIAEVSSSDLFEKFDSHKIIENYKEFCREKNIGDITLGLSYLSKIGTHVETK